MKLYYSKNACSLAVHIIINEIGVKCEYEAVDLATKVTNGGADFYKSTSKGAVPALELDNGEVLTENAVIQQYLADTYKATTLLPPVGDFQRYRVLEWLNFVSTDVHKNFSPLFNKKVPQDLKEEIFLPILKQKFDFVDKHLAKQDYLTGKNFTLPDGYLFVTLRWLPYFKVELSTWPALQAFFDRVSQRSAVIKSLEEQV